MSGPWLIRGQLCSHSRCLVHVYTQPGARASTLQGGSYANFNTSKYIDEVIEVDELEEGNIYAAARKTIQIREGGTELRHTET